MIRRAAIAAVALAAGCATLQNVLQPPRISSADGRTPEFRLLGPSAQRPLGGASIRLYAHVENPNPFGLTLSRLAGSLMLRGTRAADVDFPLGMPLVAGQDTVLPLDVSISFSDLPALADVVRSALGTGSLPYALEGTFTVDAGPFGQPSFGPQRLLAGSVSVYR